MKKTVAELAAQLGVSARRIEYAARSRNVEPADWVGSARRFDRAGCAAITAAVIQAKSRPAPRRRTLGRTPVNGV